MQHKEYLEVIQVVDGTIRAKVEAKVPHRVDVFTLGAHQVEEITYMQEAVVKVV